eukprot:6210656-Pleurochrysis_carterae.AAC.4
MFGIGRGEFATSATNLGCDFALKQVLGSVVEGVGTDDKEIAEAVTSSFPESEDHRAKVPPLEPPMPEEWGGPASSRGGVGLRDMEDLQGGSEARSSITSFH